MFLHCSTSVLNPPESAISAEAHLGGQLGAPNEVSCDRNHKLLMSKEQLELERH